MRYNIKSFSSFINGRDHQSMRLFTESINYAGTYLAYDFSSKYVFYCCFAYCSALQDNAILFGLSNEEVGRIQEFDPMDIIDQNKSIVQIFDNMADIIHNIKKPIDCVNMGMLLADYSLGKKDYMEIVREFPDFAPFANNLIPFKHRELRSPKKGAIILDILPKNINI